MRKQISISNLLVASALSLSIGIGGLAISSDAYAAGNTCTWTTPEASDYKFSNPNNWVNCDGGVPTDGDSLVFGDVPGLGQGEKIVNDIDNLLVSGITFNGTGYSYSARVDAGNMRLSGDIVKNSGSDGGIVAGKITLTSDVTLRSASLSAYGGNSIELNIGSHTLALVERAYISPHVISGSGSIVASGLSSEVTLYEVSDSSQFTGSIHVSDQAGLFLAHGVLGGGVDLTVNNATLDLCAFNGKSIANQLTIGGHIVTRSSCGGLGGAWGASPTEVVPEASVNWTGPIILTANVEVLGDGEFKISGPLSGDYGITLGSGSVGRVVNNSSNDSSQTGSGTQESKVTEVKLDKDQPEGMFSIGAKEVGVLTGIYGEGYVSGILRGTGTVRGYLMIAQGATIAPGMSPGCITVGSLDLIGNYEFELGGKTACTQHDQIKLASGSGVVAINSDHATLSIYSFGDFVQSIGDQFVIIDNQTNQAIQGHFKGLPEGAEVRAGNAIFTISYVGGDGNDVVLTAANNLAAPRTPNTGVAKFNLVNPVMTIIAGVLAALSLVVLKRAHTSRKSN